MRVHFLYGSETGTAEFLCDDLKEELPGSINSEISSLGDVQPNKLDPSTFYVIVTATYGLGDVAGGGAAFYQLLREEKPDLSNIRFAIFGLGDSSFSETFNHGSKRLAKELLACNAQMVGNRGISDASTPEWPDEVAVPWMKDILNQLAELTS